MKKKDLYTFVLTYLEKVSPPTDTELTYRNPFELLVAVILSAQCTDKRINEVTPALFHAYPDPLAMSLATPEEVFAHIRRVSYPNNKAKHLVGMAKMLVADYAGQVPPSFDDLVRLPGVGRKTANVISALVFGQAALAVDTHVYRVSRRIGLVPLSANTPLKVETELRRHIPLHQVADAHFWLLYHGRYTCVARTPKCHDCGLQLHCLYFSKNPIAPPRRSTR